MRGMYCSDVLKILGDETRLTVIKQLLKKPKLVNEINQHLPVSQSLLSHHLKILRDAGLVVANRVGKAVLYEISPQLKITESNSVINLGCCQLSFKKT